MPCSVRAAARRSSTPWQRSLALRAAQHRAQLRLLPLPDLWPSSADQTFGPHRLRRANRESGRSGATRSPTERLRDDRSCRNEGVAYVRIYAQRCIIFHDSASTLTSQRRLLRHPFIWTHGARSSNAESHIRGQDVHIGSARGYQEFFTSLAAGQTPMQCSATGSGVPGQDVTALSDAVDGCSTEGHCGRQGMAAAGCCSG